MSNPYKFRPRRGGEHHYTDLGSDFEETITMAEGDGFSQDPEWPGSVAASDTREVNSPAVSHPSSQVIMPAPTMHRAVGATITSRTANITPTHASTRSIDSNISRLDIRRASRQQTNHKETIKNKPETDPDYNPSNPLRRASKRVASAPALRDANGRAKQRFGKGLSPEGETDNFPRTDSPDDEEEPYNVRANRRPQIPTRLNVEVNDGQRQPSQGMPFVWDASRQDSNKENYIHPALRARVKSLLQGQPTTTFQQRRRVEEASRPPEAPEEPAPAAPALSFGNVRPEFRYGYGHDVVDSNESSFFLDALSGIEGAESAYADPHFSTHPLLAPGTMTEYEEIHDTEAQETVDDDFWMGEFIDMSM
jgi:hypothetical protein